MKYREVLPIAVQEFGEEQKPIACVPRVRGTLYTLARHYCALKLNK